MSLADYKVRLTKDSMIERATTFAPLSLASSESVAVMGDMRINGSVSCDNLRSVGVGTLVTLMSGPLDTSAANRCMFMSPVFGRIKYAYFVAVTDYSGISLNIAFYNAEGVVASSEVGFTNLGPGVKHTVTFDWNDKDDLAFCTVGVGSAFWATVYDTAVGTGFISIAIQPMLSGGSYE